MAHSTPLELIAKGGSDEERDVRIDSFSEHSRGTVRCIFSEEIARTWFHLQNEAATRSDGMRLVAHECEAVPPASILLDEMLHSLAQAAKMLWPEWYDDPIPLGGGTTIGEQEIADRISTKRLRQ